MDLNIGFESIQKLQDDWYKPRAKPLKKAADYERDSLDSGDDKEATRKASKGRDNSQIPSKENNQDWLENSIKESVSQWKATLAYHQRAAPEKTWIDQEYEKINNKVTNQK